MNNYLKTLLVTSLLSTTLSAELVKSYFDTGELKSETNYIDGTNTEIKVGIKNGIEKIYYQEGGLAYIVNYIEDKRDGTLTWYDKNGVKLADIHYKDGKLHGVETSYFENGSIKHTVTYINDKKEGIQKEYFDNGQLALIVSYKNNKKEGIQKEYTYDGILYSEVFYKNNYKEGLQKWYDKDGNIIKTELFKHDRPVNIMKKVQLKKEDTSLFVKGIDFSPQKQK
jgi:antitoxin component YwqK of YwqJK toxin-antitoxin module